MLQPPRLSPRNTRLFRVVVSLVALGSLSALLAHGPARTYRHVAAALHTQKRTRQLYAQDPTSSQTQTDITSPNSLQANGKIAFTTNRDGNFEIYSMNPDGTGQTNLSNDPANGDTMVAYSPDGSKIAFQTDRNGTDQEIYLMNANGTGAVNLSNNPAAELAPAFSPDGSKIAFSSIRDGNNEIYVMNVDGSNQTRLTNNTATEARPAYSPVGSKIPFPTNLDG